MPPTGKTYRSPVVKTFNSHVSPMFHAGYFQNLSPTGGRTCLLLLDVICCGAAGGGELDGFKPILPLLSLSQQ